MNCRGSLALSLALACTPGGSGTETTASSSSSTSATDPAPTTGEPVELQRCTPTCSLDADCLIAGQDSGFRCIAGACQVPPCSDDAACRVAASGWQDPCADQAACGPGRACIVIDGGEGRCAALEGDMFMCTDLGLVALARDPIEGGRPVLVCGDDRSTCVDDHCARPCLSDAECPPQLGQPHCDVPTGACRCSADADCQMSGQPGLTACLAGTCGCQVDADCQGGSNVDTCVAGACGCSSTAACTSPVFDHVTQICQPA